MTRPRARRRPHDKIVDSQQPHAGLGMTDKLDTGAVQGLGNLPTSMRLVAASGNGDGFDANVVGPLAICRVAVSRADASIIIPLRLPNVPVTGRGGRCVGGVASSALLALRNSPQPRVPGYWLQLWARCRCAVVSLCDVVRVTVAVAGLRSRHGRAQSRMLNPPQPTPQAATPDRAEAWPPRCPEPLSDPPPDGWRAVGVLHRSGLRGPATTERPVLASKPAPARAWRRCARETKERNPWPMPMTMTST
jgi:hypothetical protein